MFDLILYLCCFIRWCVLLKYRHLSGVIISTLIDPPDPHSIRKLVVMLRLIITRAQKANLKAARDVKPIWLGVFWVNMRMGVDKYVQEFQVDSHKRKKKRKEEKTGYSSLFTFNTKKGNSGAYRKHSGPSWRSIWY